MGYVNRRAACGRERTPYLENEVPTWVAREIEIEWPCQLSRRVKTIDTRRERETTQILTSQVASDRHEGQRSIRSRDVNLSLLRDRISLVYESCEGDTPQASDRSPGIDAEISEDGGGTGIGHR